MAIPWSHLPGGHFRTANLNPGSWAGLRVSIGVSDVLTWEPPKSGKDPLQNLSGGPLWRGHKARLGDLPWEVGLRPLFEQGTCCRGKLALFKWSLAPSTVTFQNLRQNLSRAPWSLPTPDRHPLVPFPDCHIRERHRRQGTCDIFEHLPQIARKLLPHPTNQLAIFEQGAFDKISGITVCFAASQWLSVTW